MTIDDAQLAARPVAWLKKFLAWLLAAGGFLLRMTVTAWATLAIYHRAWPETWLNVVLACIFFAFAVWALWTRRSSRKLLAFAAVYAVILIAWSTIEPSHDREWRPEVAVMPRVTIDGDRVRIAGVRNFEYRSRADFTVRHEEREVSLSRMTGVDFFISYWAEGPVGHTFVSFLFEDAPPLSISIETRPEVGEGFAPVASLFKQFELIYIVGDEQDLVGLRASHRQEEVFLYHTRISPEFARRLFLIYAERINELADQAEFYHLLSNSCTVNIIRYANAAGRVGRFSIKHLLNGLIDQYIYAAGVVDTSLPFEELRRRSRITAAAQAAAGSEDFSARIREGLPRRGQTP
jgi:hypothetical protein